MGGKEKRALRAGSSPSLPPTTNVNIKFRIRFGWGARPFGPPPTKSILNLVLTLVNNILVIGGGAAPSGALLPHQFPKHCLLFSVLGLVGEAGLRPFPHQTGTENRILISHDVFNWTLSVWEGKTLRVPFPSQTLLCPISGESI